MERYKQECQKIKEQINPSDEFLQNLKSNLNKKVSQEKAKRRNYFSKVAVIFFTITLVSSGAFAMNIGDWLSQFFANTDESMQIAMENGYVQNVDTDYIENDGIAIKVNSLMLDEDKINIIFDVKGQIDGDLLIKELFLNTEEDSSNDSVQHSILSYDRELKSIDKNNHILFLKIYDMKQDLNNIDRLEIILKDLCIFYGNRDNTEINGEWNFKIDIKEISKNNLACKYIVEENKYLENYNINKTSAGISVQLSLKNMSKEEFLIEEHNIYIQAENGEKFLCRDFYRIGKNEIYFNIPLENEINNFKILLKINNENVTFNVKKENS